MLENDHSPENFELPTNKPPRSLIMLLTLSAINVVSSLWTSVASFYKGPLTEEELETGLSGLYQSINEMRSQDFGESLIEMVEQVIQYSIHVNAHSFYLNNALLIVTFLVGLASLYFMYRLKKIGFHLYILYCFLPVIVMYVVAPPSVIPNLNIVFTMIISGIFALLYGRHLKIFK